MKVLIITSCGQCVYLKEWRTAAGTSVWMCCKSHAGLTNQNVWDELPDWCKLPDYIEDNAKQKS